MHVKVYSLLNWILNMVLMSIVNLIDDLNKIQIILLKLSQLTIYLMQLS